ncbi:GNAT family N-acetyltransferase [Sporosalibacterium faouarense]|uniref:GNAT family N-acetyltransferase n=1 Tax=Sporosalibacterium faouarense TaxID=516123 RepID=UPI00192AC292|nr:GNAT family N-acetyltransferase [Sporosalibacterium faouarense]
MKNIINKARNYKFNTLAYVDIEDMSDAEVILNNEDDLFIARYSDEKIHLDWAAESKADFLSGLQQVIGVLKEKSDKKIYTEFVPENFVIDLEKLGFEIESEYIDFWNNDLINLTTRDDKSLSIRKIEKEEYNISGEITRACEGYSRGFCGESNQWIKDWNESENSWIFVGEISGEIVGVCCIRLYGFDSEKGTVLWIRELAVHPKHQSQGIGYKLINYAMKFGKKNGAKRSFLACDAENHNAIKLYEKFGFQCKDERGQINMVTKTVI